jgi:hypothetical protein
MLSHVDFRDDPKKLIVVIRHVHNIQCLAAGVYLVAPDALPQRVLRR